MHLRKFEKKTLKFYLLNKFYYKNITKLPLIKKIIINLGCRNNHAQNLAASLLAMELVTNQKSILTKAKKPNLPLRIREGSFSGCKVTLRKNSIYNFVARSTHELFPVLKNFAGVSEKANVRSFSYELKNIFVFTELEKNYMLFKNVGGLKVTLAVARNNFKTELLFLKKAYQFVLEKK